MGRPRKEKHEIEERFLQEALLLAESYSMILIEQKDLHDLLTGNFVYTEDMAIQELMGGGQQEGERVQTSNISNIPERIAILLADGFVEKQRARMRREAQQQILEYRQLCDKIQIVETAMAERMDARTRAVFRCLYIERKPWSRVRDEYGNHLAGQQIKNARDAGIIALAKEMIAAQYFQEKEEQNGTQ